MKYSDFSQITRSVSVKSPFKHSDSVKPYLIDLFHHIPRELPIRLVGVTFSNLTHLDNMVEQLDLFDG
ncbi:hypothetical protein [Moraxella lacunata]|uniref:DinB/UmuC family translesion DNA polymerase n=1 Tax=Moraxella lacunata TaxID=477 RepID=UPI000E0E3093